MRALSTLAFVGLLPHVAVSHGILTKPISRALSLATAGLEGVESMDPFKGQRFAGTCPMASCQWYNQDKTTPPGQKTTLCDPSLRTMGSSCQNETDWPCEQKVPWCAPGTASVMSPCGVYSGGWHSNGRDMRELPPVAQETWKAGSEQEVSWSVIANHGGGYAYRLCKKSGDQDIPTEACFQATHLHFADGTTRITNATGDEVTRFRAVRTSKGTWPVGSEWTVNPVPMEEYTRPRIPKLQDAFGRGPFAFNIVDKVKVPGDLESGQYVLSWRWDAEQTKQVWMQCSDVRIEGRAPAGDEKEGRNGARASSHHYERRTIMSENVCRGSSLGLDVGDCDAWVALYDALSGASWPRDQTLCPNLRLDPCGCGGSSWESKLVCTDKRDLKRISEIYLMGGKVSGEIPKAIEKLTALVALSIVGTNVEGRLPGNFGKLSALEMIWLDHNPRLGGALPRSMENLTKLTALELHHSNFSGALPRLPYEGIRLLAIVNLRVFDTFIGSIKSRNDAHFSRLSEIPDCTLADNEFDCPLPRGAEICGATCI